MNSKFTCYICSVKIHQKILIIFALFGLFSAGFNPAYSVDSQSEYTEWQLQAAFAFDTPEPFSAALLEQSRIPFASLKLPTSYFNLYEPTVALIILPLQLAKSNPLSLHFVSDGASFALRNFLQNILFPFHFFG